MKNLTSLLEEVSEKMKVRYNDSSIHFEEWEGGEIYFNKLAANNGLIECSARIYVPKRISDNELAIKGVLAHETGHVRLYYESWRHRAYIWMRKRSTGYYFPFVDSLIFIVPAIPLFFIEEKRVDDLARDYGFDKEISEAKRIIPRGIAF